ncbi:hypothetical protein IAE57_08680 [Stenotrophomonas sp. S48]|uniref:hypothetical protein n=1 Tax=unclassified Stenotrophomonas TaxID=196198 RepID=UPI0019004553|nr:MULTISPECIES: hypothetical protein [unclassified Stenotrophomonas]MBK0026239.1 hypothetical protein [Stenotrophomonas sp. S48]MBK0049613.1 hypothetical protein [Stenotrophomonas sp. S49]
MANSFREEISLSVSRALIGEVFPSLVAVCVFVTGPDDLTLYFFLDRQVDDHIEDAISCIETEVIADFARQISIEIDIRTAERPQLPEKDAFWIFYRRLE